MNRPSKSTPTRIILELQYATKRGHNSTGPFARGLFAEKVEMGDSAIAVQKKSPERAYKLSQAIWYFAIGNPG